MVLQFIRSDWTVVLLLVAALACPVMHAFGRRREHGHRSGTDGW